jgi:hypothetical protein
LIRNGRPVVCSTKLTGHITERGDHAELAETRGQCGQSDCEDRSIGPLMESEGLHQ